jgi:hypothetical protein
VHQPSSWGISCRGRCAPPRRPEPRPWLPGGCAGRSGRGRACLRHGCGPCTPPRAWGLANGHPGCSGGRRDALELRGNPHPELAVAAQLGCCELAGIDPSMLLQVPSQDAATRRTGSDERTLGYRVEALCTAHEGKCTRASRPAHSSAAPRPCTPRHVAPWLGKG